MATICLGAAVPGQSEAADLTLERVMLSSVGMGYFEYAGEVDGNDTLSLTVPLDQVDDVLKSVVIVDGRGGSGTVSMPGREPLAQIFRELPFGRDALNSPATILNAMQGAEIKVTGARAIEGRVMRAVPEKVALPDRQGVVTRHRVTVMTATGLQQFILEDAESVTFASPEVQAQVNTALSAIATHGARDRRTLSIAVRGAGKGRVTVAYVVSVPLWKSTYRMTVGGSGPGGTARFQGWAVIDNMSGQDWNDVELTLVSGGAVTFRQALYAAYYVDRPEVPVEVMGRILPRLDTGVVANERAAQAQRGGGADLKEEQEKRKRDFAQRLHAAPMSALRSMSVAGQTATADLITPEPSEARIAQATAQEGATQVVFRLERPVRAKNGQSLMVPIIDRTVPAERIALYQPATHALHPLSSVRLTNDGDTGLPPGVLTLYESAGAGPGRYVGDARLGALPAGEKRLVSHALDLRTRIDKEVKRTTAIAKGKISRGVLTLTVIDTQRTVYRVKAPAKEPRRVVVEHPRQAGWELDAAMREAAELTPTHYRLARDFKAGEEGEIDVALERERLQRLQLVKLSEAAIVGYARNAALDPKIRQSFERMAGLRRAIEVAERRLGDLEAARKRIFEEQNRIRSNLSRVRQNTDLHKRYMAKLDAQETELERIDNDTDSARRTLQQAKDALESYVAALEL